MRVTVVLQKNEARLADADTVAMLEHALAYGLAVDERAVETVEVNELVLRAFATHDAVAAREQRVGYADAVRRLAPDGYILISKLDGRVLQRPRDDGRQNLQPLGTAARATRLSLGMEGSIRTNVTLFDQGLTQILQAAVTGLAPGRSYQLVLASRQDGTGDVEPIASFTANPAGSAIVNTNGPIRQVVQDDRPGARRWLAIRAGTSDAPGAIVQVQQP